MKKISVFLLSFGILLSMTDTTVFAESELNTYQEGDCSFAWKEENGSVTILTAAKTSGDTLIRATIPETIEGMTVTKINEYAFYEKMELEELILPDTIEEIGESAFYACAELKELILPKNLKTIGNNAFYECDALETLTIPEGVTSIGDTAFSECLGLKTIYFPSTLESLGEYPFPNTYQLESIEVAEGCSAYISVDGVLFDKNMTRLIAYPSGNTRESYQIPETVTKLDKGAFVYATSLKEIDLANVTDIGSECFMSCSGLEEIVIPEGITTLEESAFLRCDNLVSVTLPDSLESVGDYCFASCVMLEELYLPKKVNHIGDGAFGFQLDLIGNDVLRDGDIHITCKKDSAGAKFCKAYGISYSTYGTSTKSILIDLAIAIVILILLILLYRANREKQTTAVKQVNDTQKKKNWDDMIDELTADSNNKKENIKNHEK